MAATEVQWSELQRDPKGVAALADRGDVRVRRRDGAALLLTREDRLAGAEEGAIVAGRALRGLLAHLPAEATAEALLDEFPWAGVLPAEERAQFVHDLVRGFRASAELGQWSLLATTIREWRNTAVVHADPELSRQLSAPVTEDFGPVASPMKS
ncbi:hypothetical protein [Goodfellowiella coeruleoviolacea]|uniref:Prevent-host-death family protein n=1 Tax=Goodfellowiella coeruleoviolacea TaxID=334858 RepID=A0AAE3GC39_9PSEU|nr:hypothetical protein [Goodfellowiella coeruleoviolacea]MCP2165496.1 hypothetical protein [Goodfellowiella coeruleoviolacea]